MVFMLEMNLGLRPTLQNFSGSRQVVTILYVLHNPSCSGSFTGDGDESYRPLLILVCGCLL